MTQKIILERPGGYGEAGLIERNPLYYKYTSKRPYWIALSISFPLLILGLMPIIWMYTSFNTLFDLAKDVTFRDIGINFLGSSIYLELSPLKMVWHYREHLFFNFIFVCSFIYCYFFL
jgi:hypothetical protein